MANAEKPPIERWWTDILGSYHWLRDRFGLWPLLVLALPAAVVLAWWKWDDLAKKPGIKPGADWIGDWWERKPILPARADRLTMAIAHLENDTDTQQEALLHDELSHGFVGADTRAIDRTVALPDAETDQAAIEKATDEARHLLREAGADVLIWGRVIALGNRAAIRLYWTPALTIYGAKQTERYQLPTDTIAMPPLFWDDLRQVLGLLVQSRLGAMADELNGRFATAWLAPLIGQVRKLLEARRGKWPAETEVGVRFAFAWALQTYGEQAGDNAALAESIASYQQVLSSWTRDRMPLGWAMTQNNLGNALLMLGNLETGTARLREAVDAYRLALQERTRDRVPLDWAYSQHSLAITLEVIALRQQDPAGMAAAITAMRGAADVYRDGGNTHWLSVAEGIIRRMEAERAGMAAGR